MALVDGCLGCFLLVAEIALCTGSFVAVSIGHGLLWWLRGTDSTC